MLDKSKLFFITEAETVVIDNWVKENKYTFLTGVFVLQFDSSIFGDSVVIWHSQGGNFDTNHYLEIDEGSRRENLPRTVDHIVIDGFTVSLRLSEAAMNKYFKLGSECTESHINEDCEPPSFDLSFKIKNNICEIYAGIKLIDTQLRRQ